MATASARYSFAFNQKVYQSQKGEPICLFNFLFVVKTWNQSTASVGCEDWTHMIW